MNPLKTWFARQSLTVKLLITIPVLLAAVLWSLTPEDPTPAAPGAAPENRPVLSAESPSAQATIAPHQEPRAADSGLSWVTALRTVVSVAVVVGLILLSARGLKHVMAGAGQLPGAGGALKVLDTTYLPSPNGRGRSAIHLLETPDGRHLLVGATDTQLSLLAEYDEGARFRLADELSTEETAAAQSVRRAAGRVERAGFPTAEPANPPAPEPDTTRPARFDEVLERLRQSARALEQAS